jgi:hypothetical protein
MQALWEALYGGKVNRLTAVEKDLRRTGRMPPVQGSRPLLRCRPALVLGDVVRVIKFRL